MGDQPHCDSLLRPEDLNRKEPAYPLQACFCRDCTAVQMNYTVPKETMFGEDCTFPARRRRCGGTSRKARTRW